LFEVDVERGEAGVLRFEVFGGWVVCVCKEEMGCNAPACGDEFFEFLSNANWIHPADEIGRDFVSDVDAGEGRVRVVQAKPGGELDQC